MTSMGEGSTVRWVRKENANSLKAASNEAGRFRGPEPGGQTLKLIGVFWAEDPTLISQLIPTHWYPSASTGPECAFWN